MAGKEKLRKFAENEILPNVIQPTRESVEKGLDLKGKWRSDFFKNKNPIVLELGCGKGEYSVGLAEHFPDKNFIGVDVKGARIWRGAKTAHENKLTNVSFLRTQIELIDLCFEENEVDEIWITFPDPQIKYKRAKHRLTHPLFIARYQKILKEGGLVHLKTDSEFLHGYTHGIIQENNHEVLFSNHNIYKPHTLNVPEYVQKIQTFYEKKYLEVNKPITYVQFKIH